MDNPELSRSSGNATNRGIIILPVLVRQALANYKRTAGCGHYGDIVDKLITGSKPESEKHLKGLRSEYKKLEG